MGRPPRDHAVFVKTSDDFAVAAGHSVEHGVDSVRWQAEFDELLASIGPRFFRVEPRLRVRRFLAGLLSDMPVKNCWTIAEHAGETRPDGMQRLLADAAWDQDGVRDDLRVYVVDRLRDTDAVLVVDETGDLKKGTKTVGVQRQYSGTAGRIENCQIAVYLSYVSKHGHAFLDRELYLPKSWMNPESVDPCCQARREAAGIPDDIEFATKPELATTMILAALDAGVPANWVAADEVYGQNPGLRAALCAARIGYVLAVPCSYLVSTMDGRIRADVLVGGLDASKWGRYSAGDGAKGQRLYDWARLPLITHDQAADDFHWLLVRRSISTGELAYYHCYSPRPVKLGTLVHVAGRRWPTEENFQTGKGQTGLDAHQVRQWISWYRWTILVMVAHAFLTVLAATAPKPAATLTRPLIPLTVAETRRLINAFLNEVTRTTNDILTWTWSIWRRQHQAIAKQAHYQRQRALHS